MTKKERETEATVDISSVLSQTAVMQVEGFLLVS